MDESRAGGFILTLAHQTSYTSYKAKAEQMRSYYKTSNRVLRRLSATSLRSVQRDGGVVVGEGGGGRTGTAARASAARASATDHTKRASGEQVYTSIHVWYIIYPGITVVPNALSLVFSRTMCRSLITWHVPRCASLPNLIRSSY